MAFALDMQQTLRHTDGRSSCNQWLSAIQNRLVLLNFFILFAVIIAWVVTTILFMQKIENLETHVELLHDEKDKAISGLQFQHQLLEDRMRHLEQQLNLCPWLISSDDGIEDNDHQLISQPQDGASTTRRSGTKRTREVMVSDKANFIHRSEMDTVGKPEGKMAMIQPAISRRKKTRFKRDVTVAIPQPNTVGSGNGISLPVDRFTAPSRDGIEIPQDHIYAFWEPTEWSAAYVRFRESDGRFQIRQGGLYLVNIQVQYTSSGNPVGFALKKNSSPTTLYMSCLDSTTVVAGMSFYRHCAATSVQRLLVGEELYIADYFLITATGTPYRETRINGSTGNTYLDFTYLGVVDM